MAGRFGYSFTRSSSFYSAFPGGQSKPELRNLDVQYADFAFWQRRWMTGEVLARHRDYWRDKLRNPPILRLRPDFAPGTIRTLNSSVFYLTIDAEILAGLKEISRRAGATLYTVLIAAFATLLMRDFGAGRPHHWLCNVS